MIKNISLALLALLMQMGIALSQTPTIDSLNYLLQTEQQDSTRSLLLSQLCRAYLYSKPDTALLLAQQGLVLAKSINFTPGEISGLKELGNVFSTTGNDAKALELYLQALKKSENSNDKTNLARVLNNIGIVYAQQGDYQRSLNYFLQSITIALNMQDELMLLTCSVNLGIDYQELNKLDSAKFYTNQGYDLAVKQHSNENIAIALDNLGYIYSKMQQPDVAMANFRLSIPYFTQEKDEDGICETAIGMAKLFRQQDKDDSCLYYAKLAYTTAQKGGFIQRVLTTGNFLADYYKEHTVVDSAYTYLLAVIAAKDSLFSQEKQREIQSLSFDESMRQQQIALTKTSSEKQRSHNIQFAIIAISIISFIIIFLLLSRTVVVNEKWIRFLGVLGLLLLFEFINLFIHPYISEATDESPLYSLLIMVAVASLLIPLHHKLEHWIKEKIVAKNKKIRLAAAKRTVAELEGEGDTNNS